MVVGPLCEEAARTLDESGECVYKCIIQRLTWAITSLVLLLRNRMSMCMAILFFSPKFLGSRLFPTYCQPVNNILLVDTVLELRRQWLLLCVLPQECYKVLFQVSLCYTTERDHCHFFSRQKELIKTCAPDQDWPLS